MWHDHYHKTQQKIDHLLPIHDQCLHYGTDYVEIYWARNAIKSEPYLLNLKIRTQNICSVNLFTDQTWHYFPLYMLYNLIQLLKCTNLWLCIKLRLVSVETHMCNFYNMFQLPWLLFHFSSQEKRCSSHRIAMEMRKWVKHVESVHINNCCVDT
jgi:hypothetical protein